MSKPIIKFTGVVKGGKVYLDEPENYESHLHTLDEKRIELTIQKEKISKTTKQLRYYFGVVLKIILDEGSGQWNNKDEANAFFESQFLREYDMINNKRYTRIRGVSDLNTIEMTEFIENVKRFASTEMGLFIPEAIKFKI